GGIAPTSLDTQASNSSLLGNRLNSISNEATGSSTVLPIPRQKNTRRQIDSDFEEEEEEVQLANSSKTGLSPSRLRKLLSPSGSPSPQPSSPKSGSDEDIVSEDLRILSRKTRGVLPASYHVFNHGDDSAISSHHRTHRIPKAVPSGPGIARTKISSRPRSGDRDLPVV